MKDERPKVGGLTVPYMVDASQNPIDFKIVDADHEHCAQLAMTQCPFLTGKMDWREDRDNPLLSTYAHNMKLFLAKDGEAHRDQRGAWHFKAIDLIDENLITT